MNPFHSLHIPLTFKIDRRVLDEQFQLIQKQALSLPESLKDSYVSQANYSYNILKNPIQRAHSIMEILGIIHEFFDIFDEMEEFIDVLHTSTNVDSLKLQVYDDFHDAMVEKNHYGMHLAYAKMKRLHDKSQQAYHPTL
jgi:hypothetical protein